MPPSTFLPNFGLIGVQMWPPGSHLENQLRSIDPKLCTYVPLGKSNSQTKFWSSLILDLVTRGSKPKTDITPEQTAGSSPNFYHRYKDTWHNSPGFWFDQLFKVTEVKVQNIVLLLFGLECSNFARTSWFVLLLFVLECSSFVLINHPTLHVS
jgi:hypothetical protein